MNKLLAATMIFLVSFDYGYAAQIQVKQLKKENNGFLKNFYSYTTDFKP